MRMKVIFLSKIIIVHVNLPLIRNTDSAEKNQQETQ